MRKHIIFFLLILTTCLSTHAQSWMEDMVVARQMVDSLKQELKTAKGGERIDCLNLLSATYSWMWDENDKHLDSVCMYADEAYDLAKKTTYKKGLGYAILWKAHCFAGRTDNDINNNNTEINYLQSEKWAQQAIQIGEEIKDYRLIGDVYSMLKWMERWRGSAIKYKDYVEKTIYYYEKPVIKKLSGLLNISKCAQCQGNEKLLGSLYQQYAQILSSERKDVNIIKHQIDKAIFYFSKIGNKWGLAGGYRSLGQLANNAINLEAGIEYLLKAVALSGETGNPRGELDALNDLCSAYWNMGDFENGLNISRRSLTLAENGIRNSYIGSADSLRLGQAYYWHARFYEIAGDYTTSLAFFNKARIFYPPIPGYNTPLMVALGELHRKAGNYDSAKVYLMQFEKRDGGKPMLANLYVSLKQYDDALRILNLSREQLVYRNNNLGMGRNLLIVANAYLGKNNLEQALIHATKGVNLLGQMKRNVYLIDGYKVLSEVFDKLGKGDSAFYYLKKYSQLKDSLLTRQFYFRLNDYKKEAEELKRIGRIKLLEKDNLVKAQQIKQQLLRKAQNEAQLSLMDKDYKIKEQQLQIKDQELKQQTLFKDRNQTQLILLDKENKLKDQRLKQQSFIRNALIAGLFLLLALSVFIFRILSLKRKNERLQNEKRHAELQQKASELEMQALRAQMNPHFIFNCLSSINKFILKNDTDAASDYLTRFSRLIRQSLTNSQLSLIPINDEIETLRLYLDMERLRFSESFTYNIIYENMIEPETIYIPPMLLQPFCENAIWHGLMHKQGPGKLDVIMSLTNGELQCIIADNGIGRQKAAELKSRSNGKQKSFGLKITTERLALFNNEKTVHSFYKTEDVLDSNKNIAGTKVILNIKFKNSVLKSVNQSV